MGTCAAGVSKAILYIYSRVDIASSERLRAPSEAHLCKTLIMENTKCIVDDCSGMTQSLALFYSLRPSSDRSFEFKILLRDCPIRLSDEFPKT